MLAGTLCSKKVHVARADESAQAAARRMAEERVGTLLVVDAEKRPIGIVTDRDLALRVVGPAADPCTTKVTEVMTAHPRCVEESMPIEAVVQVMRDLGVRRLPVVDARKHLVGIVSVDDLVEAVAQELHGLGRILAASEVGNRALAQVAPPSKARPTTAGLERSRSDLEC